MFKFDFDIEDDTTVNTEPSMPQRSTTVVDEPSKEILLSQLVRLSTQFTNNNPIQFQRTARSTSIYNILLSRGHSTIFLRIPNVGTKRLV